MATAAHQKYERAWEARRYKKGHNRRMILTYLKTFDNVAHAHILVAHIECFGKKPCILEVLHNDTDAQKLLGLSFIQVRRVINHDLIYRKITTGPLTNCCIVLRLEECPQTIFYVLVCRNPTEKIVITASFRGPQIKMF